MENIYKELHGYVEERTKHFPDVRWMVVEQNENWLLNHLDGRAEKHFLKYRDTRDALNAEMNEQSFREGVHLGLMLITEARCSCEY